MRQDVDIGLAKFLSQEMTENSKRSELTALLEEVDELEAEVGPDSATSYIAATPFRRGRLFKQMRVYAMMGASSSLPVVETTLLNRSYRECLAGGVLIRARTM